MTTFICNINFTVQSNYNFTLSHMSAHVYMEEVSCVELLCVTLCGRVSNVNVHIQHCDPCPGAINSTSYNSYYGSSHVVVCPTQHLTWRSLL